MSPHHVPRLLCPGQKPSRPLFLQGSLRLRLSSFCKTFRLCFDFMVLFLQDRQQAENRFVFFLLSRCSKIPSSIIFSLSSELPSSHSLWVCLLARDSLNFLSSENVLISLSFLKDIFFCWILESGLSVNSKTL